MGSASSTPTPHSNEKTTTAPLETPKEVLSKATSAETASTAEATPATTSGCPMHNGDGTYRFSLWGGLPPNHPQKKDVETPDTTQPTTAPQVSSSQCPVQHSTHPSTSSSVEYNVYGQAIDPRNQMPHNPNQLPSPQQTISLSTQRVASSIPKGGAADPQHTWLYPSPQMFYNALQRKHKLEEAMPADDVEAVVRIHNQMNEATWQKIRQWEALQDDPEKEDPEATVKLLKFQGRPSDLSPKAAIKHYLLGHPLPFDRHDWVLERPGTSANTPPQQQRYVLDYYYNEHQPPYVMVDVRPALDSWSALWQRVVVMPYARYVRQSTPFDYLPLWPSPDMQTQVAESVQVWRQIQQKPNPTPAAVVSAPTEDLTRQFQTALRSCQAQQQALAQVPDDDDAAAGAASLQLSLCLGRVICPVQVQAWQRVLDEPDGPLLADAWDRLQECLALQSQQYRQAKAEEKEKAAQ